MHFVPILTAATVVIARTGLGTGTHCQDTNECTTADDDCDSNAVCLNTVGKLLVTVKRLLRERWELFGCRRMCCLTHSCHVNALCTNTIPGYSCTCSDGFAGDGFTCDDVDECLAQTSNCHPMADCINSVGSYECQCVSVGTGMDSFVLRIFALSVTTRPHATPAVNVQKDITGPVDVTPP